MKKIALLGAALALAAAMPVTANATMYGPTSAADPKAQVNQPAMQKVESKRAGTPWLEPYGPRESAHSPSSPEAAAYVGAWWDERTDTAHAGVAPVRFGAIADPAYRDGVHHANQGKDGTPFRR